MQLLVNSSHQKVGHFRSWVTNHLYVHTFFIRRLGENVIHSGKAAEYIDVYERVVR